VLRKCQPVRWSADIGVGSLRIVLEQTPLICTTCGTSPALAKLHNVPICKVGGSRPLKLPLSRPPLARPRGFTNKTLCKMSMAERARASQCLPVPGYMPWHRPARARAICVQRASSQAAPPHIGEQVLRPPCPPQGLTRWVQHRAR